MVVKIHDLDIRVKYTLQLLHQVLVLVLKFVIKNHKHCSDKVDLGKGLSEVLQKNFQDFKGTKLYKELNYKQHFIDSTNKLKTTIYIESLDISILTLLITEKFIYEKSHLTKCCSNCKHNKCSCGLNPKDCPNKANCGLSCSCKAAPCDVVRILKFCSVARSLRNCFAHAADDVYQKLENKNGGLKEFPQTKTWIELWTLINKETLSCLKIILTDPNLLSKETYKDFKMELWFVFRKQINCLLPLVDAAHYYQTILGEANSQENIDKICKEIQRTKKDCPVWKGKYLDFSDEKNVKESFKDVMHTDLGCVLLYNTNYKKISIQWRHAHGKWKPLSEESTKTTIDGDITKFEVNHLNLGYKYDFRGLFENVNGEILLLTSKDSIKIKNCLIWNGKYLDICDEENIKESFKDVMHTNEGCVLLYNTNYTKISIQWRHAHGKWKPLSEESTKTTIDGDITEFEVNHLNLGYKYDFRGLFENANGEILLLTSKEIIEIKKVDAKDGIMIGSKTVCVTDFEVSRLEVKTGCDNIDLIYDINSIKEIKRIEVRNPNQSEAWENGDWEQHIDNDDNLQGLIRLKSLKNNQVYDIRLIGRGKNREIKLLTQNGVKVGVAAHETWFNEKLLLSHPFGLQTDASQHLLNNSPPAHSTFPIKYKSGGGQKESHITEKYCIRYVEKNFLLGESGKKNIIVPHLEQLNQNSLSYKITLELQKVLSKENNYLFTGVNFYDYLENIEYSKKELEDEFEGHLKDLSNVLALYPAEYPAVILITLPESEKDTIDDLWLNANANVKAYQILHRHRLIEEKGFAIINVIGAVFHKKSKLLKSYCDSCSPNLLILPEDLENGLRTWWRNLKKMMETDLTEKYNIENDDTNFSHETASLLVLFAALTDDRFPTLFANDDERIRKMVLNESQRNILFDLSPRKIIKGGYGCGKSIIVHQQIQRYQDKENSILCYLGMDEYSLHQVLVDEHCAKISKSLKQKIVSKSVVDVSLDAGSSNRLLSFTECLEEIQKCYPGKQIDIVVDELDSEDLNEQEIDKLKEILKLPAFKSSIFYISLQSCQKKRQLEHNGKLQKETESHYKGLGNEIFKIFELHKTMRFTSNIGNAVTSSQEKVEEKPNIYPCNLPKAEIKERDHNESVSETSTPEVNVKVGGDEQRSESTGRLKQISGNPEDNQGKPKPNNMDVPTMKMDSSFRHSEVDESSTKIISHFEYFKSNGSGVNIKGKKPNLLRLNNEKSVQPLAYFLRECCQRVSKMMLICNTKDLIDLAKAALQTFGLTYVEYTDSIRSEPAKTTLTKKLILDEWRKDKQVLLVDCRGCRGMECQEVVVLWDESDYHSKHMFGESIARARSLLQIVTLNGNSSTNSSMNEVVDVLIKEGHVEDVTEDCNAHAHTILNVVPVDQFRDFVAINSSLIRDLNDLLIAPLLSTIKSNFLKWDGEEYHEVNVNRKTLRFDDVWKMLKDKKFDNVSKIIKQKPNLINSMRDEGYDGRTFLMYAVRYHRKDIVEYLSNQQHDLSVVNDFGWNVLHHIVWLNDDDVTFEMLNSLDISQLNDDVINKQNNFKQTPLYFAAGMNKHKSIVWLMDQGADPSLKNVDGERPDEHRLCSDETKNIIRNFKKW